MSHIITCTGGDVAVWRWSWWRLGRSAVADRISHDWLRRCRHRSLLCGNSFIMCWVGLGLGEVCIVRRRRHFFRCSFCRRSLLRRSLLRGGLLRGGLLRGGLLRRSLLRRSLLGRGLRLGFGWLLVAREPVALGATPNHVRIGLFKTRLRTLCCHTQRVAERKGLGIGHAEFLREFV